jgi:hypothetical protein
MLKQLPGKNAGRQREAKELPAVPAPRCLGSPQDNAMQALRT